MSRELLKMALDALEENTRNEFGECAGECIGCETPYGSKHHPRCEVGNAIDALRAALAAPEAEPVAWRWLDQDGYSTIQSVKPYHDAEPLYATPPAQPAPAAPAVPVSWERLRTLMDGIPTREEFIGGQRQQYVAKEAVMGWLYEGQLRAEREAALSAAPAVPLTDESVAIADGTFNCSAPLGTPLYAQPIREVVVHVNYREMWRQTLADNQRLCAALAAAPVVREPLSHKRLFELLQEVDQLAVRLPSGWERWARVIERAHGIGESNG